MSNSVQYCQVCDIGRMIALYKNILDILFIIFKFTLFNRSYYAIVLTAFLVGRATSFAPDAQKAKLSASRIFTLVNRCPKIDNYSQDGETLVSILKYLKYNMWLST